MRALNTKLTDRVPEREKQHRVHVSNELYAKPHYRKAKERVGPLFFWPLFPQPTQHSWEAQCYRLGNSLF